MRSDQSTADDIKVSVELYDHPKCRRCMKRDAYVGRDEWQPMLCQRCCRAIGEQHPDYIPTSKPDKDRVKICLREHTNQCWCWAYGCFKGTRFEVWVNGIENKVVMGKVKVVS